MTPAEQEDARLHQIIADAQKRLADFMATATPAQLQHLADIEAQQAALRAASYSTRSSAVRAARQACKKALGKSFEAFEGPDYAIHPVDTGDLHDRYQFELRGPAKDEAEAAKQA